MTQAPRPIRSLLLPRWKAVLALATTSLVGGVVEALFLVSVTRTAFALADGDGRIGLIAGQFVGVSTAIAFAAGLVVVRMVNSILATWLSKAFDTPERLEATSPFYREALKLSGLGG